MWRFTIDRARLLRLSRQLCSAWARTSQRRLRSGIVNVHRSSCKVLVILCPVSTIYIYIYIYELQSSHVCNFLRMSLQWESRCFLRADRLTEIRYEADSCFPQLLCERAADRCRLTSVLWHCPHLLSPGSHWGHHSAIQHGLLIQRHHTDRLSIISTAMQLGLMRSCCCMKCTCKASTVACHIRLGSRLTKFRNYLLCWGMPGQLFLSSPFPVPDSLVVLLLEAT